MSQPRTQDEPRATRGSVTFWVYLALAIIGFAGTLWFNIQTTLHPVGPSFFSAWFANPAVSSLSWDLLTLAVAASVFMILEGRRVGIRWYWAYVLGSFITAIAFTFPLFLAVRERRLSKRSS